MAFNSMRDKAGRRARFGMTDKTGIYRSSLMISRVRRDTAVGVARDAILSSIHLMWNDERSLAQRLMADLAGIIGPPFV